MVTYYNVLGCKNNSNLTFSFFYNTQEVYKSEKELGFILLRLKTWLKCSNGENLMLCDLILNVEIRKFVKLQFEIKDKTNH